jgi:hypothetical protein
MNQWAVRSAQCADHGIIHHVGPLRTAHCPLPTLESRV